MDIFRSGGTKASVIPPSGNENVQNNAMIPNSNTPIPNGNTPGIPAVAANKSPLEEYKNLWEPPKEGEQVGIPSAVPNFALDPAKLQSTAQGIDFTAGISAEKLRQVFPGSDENGVREILNAIGRNSFSNTYAGGVKTIEAAMQNQDKTLTEKTIPELLRRNSISTQLSESNVLFNDPATAPMLKMLERQFADKYPTASAAAIREHTTNYWNSVIEKSATSQGKQLLDVPKDRKNNETDWVDWAN